MATGSAALAATVTFTATGTFSSTPGVVLSGTLAVDVTSGTLLSENLSVTGSPVLSTIVDDISIGGHRELNVEAPQWFLQLLFTPASYVGMVGGNILGAIAFGPPSGPSCGPADCTGLTGSLVAETTPLPATLPLFATGLCALGLIGCRRKRARVAIAQ